MSINSKNVALNFTDDDYYYYEGDYYEPNMTWTCRKGEGVMEVIRSEVTYGWDGLPLPSKINDPVLLPIIITMLIVNVLKFQRKFDNI